MIKNPAILTDTTLCTGCEQCVVGCKQENGLGEDRLWRQQRSIDALSPTRYCTVLRRPGNRFVRQQCRHCLEPACVSVCLVGAMQKSPEGPVVYDHDRCMGCRYCLTACPFGIPRYEWDRAVPFVEKCDMCHDRLKQGKVPACVEACPEKATIFGDREQLLQEAHQRLQAEPERYHQKVYGEREVGGTSVLYISDIPLGFLAWKPELDDEPLPERTWKALKKVPPLVVGVGGIMAGIHWIVGRRMRLAMQADADGVTKETDATDSRTKDQEHEAGQ